MSNEQPDVGEDVISIDVSGDWAHYRRVDTTTVRQTYRVPPKTTVQGLLGALIGRGRDTYYDEFSRGDIAIELNHPISIYNMAKLELSTQESAMTKSPPLPTDAMITIESTVYGDRQQNMYEYLRNPSYTLHVAAGGDFMSDLEDVLLPSPQPVYTPSLGKAECLASIDDVRTGVVGDSTETEVDSVVPARVANATNDIGIERSPAHMEAIETGRRTTSFQSIAYGKDENTIPVTDTNMVRKCDGSTVIFI